MKGKTVFTREAGWRNVTGVSPRVMDKHRACALSSIVDQYSQLLIKPGWDILVVNDRVWGRKQKETSVWEEGFMKAVTGDESPLSYLQASLCYHHLLEYTNEASGVIPQAVLDDGYARTLDLFGAWPFGKQLRSFNPLFFYDSLFHPAVVFFTYHREGGAVIRKHVHRFAHGSYELKTLTRKWAAIS
ncbi:hypothetical protein JF544_07615 [Halobacillus kuroshimensis]|uniref:Uncharacterized protein n=1 Tax=Halobacillus kuroshimensis TaxID=302481 RepID=A0ABS3DUT2_9BACI|nr:MULTISPECIES: hypothetical protein [Halobacillus]MBN8235114.1 hypothetical protein [Halobacillus kuroshimensis]